MGLSDSDSDHDSEQDDAFELIADIYANDSTKLKKQKTFALTIDFHQVEGEKDFKVDCGQDLQTESLSNVEVNNQIVLQYKSLHEKLTNYELEKVNQFNQLENWKRKYISELNDNGRGIKFEKSKLLEKLVAVEKWGVSNELVRHFYFWLPMPPKNLSFDSDSRYGNNKNHQPKKVSEFKRKDDSASVGVDPTTEIEYNEACDESNSRTECKRSLFEPFEYKTFPIGLLNTFSLSKIKNFHQFILSILKIDNTLILNQIATKLNEIEEVDNLNQLTNLDHYVQILGGNVDLINSKSPMKLKLYQFCPLIDQILIKLTILFRYLIITNQFKQHESEIYRIFIYTLCDFNMIKFGYSSLVKFIKNNLLYFKNFQLINEIIQNLTTIDYNNSNLKIDYQYQYHIIKLFYQTYPQISLTNQIISYFLFEKSNYDNHDINLLLNSLELTDPITFEQAYKNVYKIQTLPMILLPFENHENENPRIANYDQNIIKANCKRLIELKIKINRLKVNYEYNFSNCLASDSSKQAINLISRSYETLANLLNKLESDLSLVNDE